MIIVDNYHFGDINHANTYYNLGILTIYIIYYTIMVDIPQIGHHTIIIINYIFTVILLYHIIISNF